jgi:hypothetical protein
MAAPVSRTLRTDIQQRWSGQKISSSPGIASSGLLGLVGDRFGSSAGVRAQASTLRKAPCPEQKVVVRQKANVSIATPLACPMTRGVRSEKRIEKVTAVGSRVGPPTYQKKQRRGGQRTEQLTDWSNVL